MWRPTELTYFPKNKVKQLACGQNMTVALCAADSDDKTEEQKDMFVCGKFAPLSASNSYKSLKEFRASDQIGNFFVDNQTLYLQVCPSQAPEKVEASLKELALEIETAQDFGFKPNQKLYEERAEAY